VVVVRLPLDRLALAVLEQTEWLWSTLTSNMDTYAILDETGGWLVNLVKWTGDLSEWQPPEGTIAVPADEVDFSSLPDNPNGF
jgi:hypothetical protein